MRKNFFKDIVPLSDLKINPGKVVLRTNDTHRPVLVTSRGRGVAVIQSLDDFQQTAEELQFVKAVAQGLSDVRENRTVSLESAREVLGFG